MSHHKQSSTDSTEQQKSPVSGSVDIGLCLFSVDKNNIHFNDMQVVPYLFDGPPEETGIRSLSELVGYPCVISDLRLVGHIAESNRLIIVYAVLVPYITTDKLQWKKLETIFNENNIHPDAKIIAKAVSYV